MKRYRGKSIGKTICEVCAFVAILMTWGVIASIDHGKIGFSLGIVLAGMSTVLAAGLVCATRMWRAR